MKIAIVGGLERNEIQFRQIASKKGHILGYHNGKVGGRGAKELNRLVTSSSFVIILMTVNSHGGVQMAKRMARQKNRPSIILMRCGLGTFKNILNSLEEKYINKNNIAEDYILHRLAASA